MTTEVKLCGVVLGTCQRRGDVSCDNTVFYDFEPADGVELPPMADMTVDFISGTIEHWHDNHTLVFTFDLVDVVTGK